MPTSTTPGPAHSRDDPPWVDCGDPRGPDFGLLFAWPVANGAVALTFDRQGRRHALTLFNAKDLTPMMVIHGRRFDVTDAAAGRLP
jgi:hypothetical protein